MTKFKLEAKSREMFGRKVSRLRKAGLIPANIFGSKMDSESIAVDSKTFLEVFKKAGETQVIYLNSKPVIVSSVQKDPISDLIIHVSFRQVDLKEKISAMIPVEIEGESPAEKQNLGTVVQQINEIEVEALPTDLPEKIIINAESLVEVDQAIYVKDLIVEKDVEIKSDMEAIVVKVEAPTVEEVAEVLNTETTEAPVTTSETTSEAPKEEDK